MKEITADDLKERYFQNSEIFKTEQLRRQFFEDDAHLPPNLETIPHREKQVQDLDLVFFSIAQGRKAYAKVYGPNGTGKTLTVNWMSKVVQRGVIEKGESDRIHLSYINCAIERGSYREIFKKIINSFPSLSNRKKYKI